MYSCPRRFRYCITIILVGILGLSGCDGEPSARSREVQIADKLFVIPQDWDHWQSGYLGDSDRGKYMRLQFTLDVDSFLPIKAEYGRIAGLRNFHMEIRPLRSEFGEVPYWTEKDPAAVNKPISCRTITEGGRQLELCEYDERVRLNSYAHGGFAKRDKATGEYISMFGCTLEKFKTNRVCSGRARLLGNIQIEYGYQKEHFDSAIELDYRARNLAISLHSPKTIVEEEIQ